MPATPTPTPTPTGRTVPRWALTTVVVVLALLVGAVAYLAVSLDHEHSQVAAAQSDVEALKPVTAQVAAQGKLIAQQKATIVGVQSQLQAYAVRLKSDEQQLSLTQQSLPPDVTRLAASVSKSVVLIACANGVGSGFVLDLPPLVGHASVVVTAGHVVSACTNTPGDVTVSQNGVVMTATLRVVDSTPEDDVAIIDVVQKLPALHAATQWDQGEFVMVTGTPLGDVTLEGSVTTGTISKVEATSFEHTAPISNGNSGGPVVNREGQVLGFVDYSIAASPDQPIVQNLNTAYRLNTLCVTALPGATCPFQ